MRADSHRISSTAVAYCRAAAVVGFVWAGFTAVGAMMLALHTRLYPALDAVQSPGGILARVVLFSAVSVGCVAVLWRLRRREGELAVVDGADAVGALDSRSRGKDGRGRSHVVLLVLATMLILVAVLLTIHLGDYPWAAPDEVHHLNVARNLAVHGSYASGHPDQGFLYFDSFDSVGPAVLGPIALTFRVFGVGLAPARGVVVVFFLGLCWVTYRFGRALFGPWPGVVAVGLLVGAYSSIYLGRTVYGEVPAYFFLLSGVLAWRRALGVGDGMAEKDGSYGVAALPFGHGGLSGQGGRVGWGLLAGVLVGLAVLSKSFIVLVGFAFAGVWLYDRCTLRRIPWPQVFFPCLGGLLPLGAWVLFQGMHAPPGMADAGGTLAIYQHYLLFGVSGFWEAFRNGVLAHPVAHVAWLGVVLLTVPVLFRGRHDPAAMVLFCYALFILYWWFFFTPGTLHRYLWNAYAILAIFAAPWVCRAASERTIRQGGTPTRVAMVGALAVLIGPALLWMGHQSREIVTKREMGPEYALVKAVDALPADARIATDVDRLPGLINFLGNRPLETGGDPIALFADYDAVITYDSEGLRAALPPGWVVQPAGDFVLLSTAQPAE